MSKLSAPEDDSLSEETYQSNIPEFLMWVFYMWTLLVFQIIKAIKFITKLIFKFTPAWLFTNIATPIEILHASSNIRGVEKDITNKLRWIVYWFWDDELGNYGGVSYYNLKNYLLYNKITITYCSSHSPYNVVTISLDFKKDQRDWIPEKNVENDFDDFVFFPEQL